MKQKLYTILKIKGFLGFCKIVCGRFVTSAIALPIALIIVAISPWKRIRLVRLFSYRIGHYALNTELLQCALDVDLFKDNQKYTTLFFISPGNPICNLQLHRMWKRVIMILPFPWIWRQVDIFLIYFFGNNYKNDPLKIIFETAEGARDRWNLLERVPMHLHFTQSESIKGKKLIEKLGISPNAPFICLLGRDSNYLKSHLPDVDWSYHDYRDVRINSYKTAAQFLAEQGYHVIRMGKNVSEKFTVDHPNIIDYANHTLRSDFLDIYLTAHCYFFISPRSGIDAVAQIFRKPLLLINFPLSDYVSLYYLDLLICKKVVDSKTGIFLTFKDMYWNTNRKSMMNAVMQKRLQFLDNSPEEMLEVLKEMLGRLNGTWQESEENQCLQDRFWHNVPEDIKPSAHNNKKIMRIGEVFLNNHKAMLEKVSTIAND